MNFKSKKISVVNTMSFCNLGDGCYGCDVMCADNCSAICARLCIAGPGYTAIDDPMKTDK